MKSVGAAFALAGLALAVFLFSREDVGAIAQLVIVAGPGLVLASIAHALPMSLNAIAWRRLLPSEQRTTLTRLTWATWVRESVNGLLPVARIGGEIVAYRIVRAGGVDKIAAAASLVADMALSVITQAAATLVGLALLLRAGIGTALAASVTMAAALLFVLGVAFVVLQRAGIAANAVQWLNRLFAGRFEDAIAGSVRVDHAFRAIYARRRDVLACIVWQCAGWLAGSVEIWLALYFLGHERSIVDAAMIELLIQAVSSAAFVVPAALGVQEGAFLLIGAAAGLDGTTALALAAARRLRDAIVFFPGLVAWHRAETNPSFAKP